MPNANLHVVPHQGKWAVQQEGSGKATSIQLPRQKPSIVQERSHIA